MGLIKWLAEPGSHLSDGLGDYSVSKGNKMLERNPKDIRCGALLSVTVDHAELP